MNPVFNYIVYNNRTGVPIGYGETIVQATRDLKTPLFLTALINYTQTGRGEDAWQQLLPYDLAVGFGEPVYAPYQRRQKGFLRPYVVGETLPPEVSISAADTANGSPKAGDMIAINPLNHDDKWLVAEAYFLDNYEAWSA